MLLLLLKQLKGNSIISPINYCVFFFFIGSFKRLTVKNEEGEGVTLDWNVSSKMERDYLLLLDYYQKKKKILIIDLF